MTIAQFSRREIALGVAFGVTAGVAYMRLPRDLVVALPSGNLNDAIPKAAEPWSMVPDASFVMPPQDEQKAAAVYERQLMRSYGVGGSAPIMLLIAYAYQQSGMLMVHRPESCYPGSGFTITDIRDVDIPLAKGIVAPGRFLSTVRDTRIEQVLYWTRLGNRFPVSWDDQRQSIAMQNLAGLVPDGALIRFSIVDPDAKAAEKTMMGFAKTLFGSCGPSGRALLAGPINA
jgi:EpsI family protein